MYFVINLPQQREIHLGLHVDEVPRTHAAAMSKFEVIDNTVQPVKISVGIGGVQHLKYRFMLGIGEAHYCDFKVAILSRRWPLRFSFTSLDLPFSTRRITTWRPLALPYASATSFSVGPASTTLLSDSTMYMSVFLVVKPRAVTEPARRGEIRSYGVTGVGLRGARAHTLSTHPQVFETIRERLARLGAPSRGREDQLYCL